MNKRTFEASQQQNDVQPLSLPPCKVKNYVKAKKAIFNGKFPNSAIEDNYFTIIREIKKLYSTLPDLDERRAVEIDHLNDFTCAMSMHTFISPHCYFHLRCGYGDNYQIVVHLEESIISDLFKGKLGKKLEANSPIQKRITSPHYRFYKMALIQHAKHVVIL